MEIKVGQRWVGKTGIIYTVTKTTVKSVSLSYDTIVDGFNGEYKKPAKAIVSKQQLLDTMKLEECMKKIYRIEIGNTKYWIGVGNQLFGKQDMAVPVTHDDHIWVMENINVEAVAYSEEFNPEIHTMGAILEKAPFLKERLK